MGSSAQEGGWDAESVAAELLDCQDAGRAREPFTEEWPDLDVDGGYRVQDLALQKRLHRGEKLIGLKVGPTSRAEQQQVGVAAPLIGWLTDAMILPSGEPVPGRGLTQPRVAPELVFVMGSRLEGPGVTCAQAMSTVESVWAGAEVIDSRYRDFRFTAADLCADNASTGAFTTGPIGLPPEQLDLTLEAALVEVDGVVTDSATGAAVQGHPGEALALAANTLAERDLAIEPGWLVLTGGMTTAVPAPAHTAVVFHFTNLGSVLLDGGR